MWWLIVPFIVILAVIAHVFEQLNRKYDDLNNKHETEIRDLKDELQELRNDINSLENTSLSEQEQAAQLFQAKPDLNICFFKNLQKGQIVRLIQGSYYYPHDDIFIVEYQYKHDHVDLDSNTGNFGIEVRGFRKFESTDEWEPCTLLATENECSTFSCSGTVKLLNS